MACISATPYHHHTLAGDWTGEFPRLVDQMDRSRDVVGRLLDVDPCDHLLASIHLRSRAVLYDGSIRGRVVMPAMEISKSLCQRIPLALKSSPVISKWGSKTAID
ncbi:hypothetical protein ASPCADRAFT_205547, partial [Aspergillus carbonarius ITEM 5010]